jgi:hypothetical protein
MGRVKEMFMEMNHEESAVEFYARLELLREMQDELVDSKVPESVKKTILKTILV